MLCMFSLIYERFIQIQHLFFWDLGTTGENLKAPRFQGAVTNFS